MNKKLLIAALLAVTLAGCSIFGSKGESKVVNQTKPQVSVLPSGEIVVPYALIYLGRQPVTITWQLPADSRYRFADNGIFIEGRLKDEIIRGDKVGVVLDPRQTEIVNCRPVKEKAGLEFSCDNKHTQPGYYKYTITLIDQQTQKPLKLDPGIMND